MSLPVLLVSGMAFGFSIGLLIEYLQYGYTDDSKRHETRTQIA